MRQHTAHAQNHILWWKLNFTCNYNFDRHCKLVKINSPQKFPAVQYTSIIFCSLLIKIYNLIQWKVYFIYMNNCLRCSTSPPIFTTFIHLYLYFDFVILQLVYGESHCQISPWQPINFIWWHYMYNNCSFIIFIHYSFIIYFVGCWL